MNFTQRFNEILNYENIKQSELAHTIGISRQCVTDYKSGKSFPSIQTLGLICGALDVSADYLLGLEDDFGVRPTDTMGDTYSSEEREIIIKYRRLPDKIKKLVRDQLEIYGERSELLPNKNKNG